MEPLDPEKVKMDSNETAAESRQRTFEAAQEESRIIKQLNQTRQQDKEEREKIRRETDEFIRIQTAKREAVRLEVSTLESQRAEAMKPVTELREEAKRRVADVEIREKNVAIQEQKNRDKEEMLLDRLEAAEDTNASLIAKEKELDWRQDKIAESESKLKDSTKELSQKWLDFHKAVATKNEDFVKREKVLKDFTLANEQEREGFKKIRKELSDKDRAITDKYQTLLMASEEFEKANPGWQTQKSITTESPQP